ncbi:hypothetical protein RJ639_001922 [Escallonia herrerae]|uniref:Uncharacterized protein n=1 Tax=Escallonia herrerae TaxID=1293975 RepID=A0AA89BTY8_9ASTE|nr:hypothetical protein RJ639_001922 [Escallonia herrerae]
MLLRSASGPILRSWINDLSPETFYRRSASVALSSHSASFSADHIKKIERTISEDDLKDLSMTKTMFSTKPLFGEPEKPEHKVGFGWSSRTVSFEGSLLGADLVEPMVVEKGEERSVLVAGGGDSCGGGGNGNRGDNACLGSDHGSESTDEHYKKMIKDNPGNGLLLGNYARFLKEVKCDFVKAEEYCGRAIMANAADGNVLSLYGDLMWSAHKDGPRANSYFDLAVQAAPEDSYVLASYARFLWDAGDEEEEEEGNEDHEVNSTGASRTNMFQGLAAPSPPPLAAA